MVGWFSTIRYRVMTGMVMAVVIWGASGEVWVGS
jgi:hypothetical protein